MSQNRDFASWRVRGAAYFIDCLIPLAGIALFWAGVLIAIGIGMGEGAGLHECPPRPPIEMGVDVSQECPERSDTPLWLFPPRLGERGRQRGLLHMVANRAQGWADAGQEDCRHPRHPRRHWRNIGVGDDVRPRVPREIARVRRVVRRRIFLLHSGRRSLRHSTNNHCRALYCQPTLAAMGRQ